MTDEPCDTYHVSWAGRRGCEVCGWPKAEHTHEAVDYPERGPFDPLKRRALEETE